MFSKVMQLICQSISNMIEILLDTPAGRAAAVVEVDLVLAGLFQLRQRAAARPRRARPTTAATRTAGAAVTAGATLTTALTVTVAVLSTDLRLRVSTAATLVRLLFGGNRRILGFGNSTPHGAVSRRWVCVCYDLVSSFYFDLLLLLRLLSAGLVCEIVLKT